jgi:hypothetical protein
LNLQQTKLPIILITNFGVMAIILKKFLAKNFSGPNLNYIHLNPIRQGIVSKAHHYTYCSTSNYIENKGLLAIEIMPSPHSFIGDKKINYDL